MQHEYDMSAEQNSITIMGIVNLTPDSFFAPSRAEGVEEALARVARLVAEGAEIIDLGAVSTRPGVADVDTETEWARLEPVLKALCGAGGRPELSVDTTRAEIVRRVYNLAGPFTVNDISAGEDDPEMLPLVAKLGLPYIAMHKRGGPQTMDDRCDYPQGVVQAVLDYFGAFARKAERLGIRDWILDPGFGFAKTVEQNYELLAALDRFQCFEKPVLAGVADKRFTARVGEFLQDDPRCSSPTERIHLEAIRHGARILRVHDAAAAARTIRTAAQTF